MAMSSLLFSLSWPSSSTLASVFTTLFFVIIIISVFIKFVVLVFIESSHLPRCLCSSNNIMLIIPIFTTIFLYLHLSTIACPASTMIFPFHSVMLPSQVFPRRPSLSWLFHICLQDIFDECISTVWLSVDMSKTTWAFCFLQSLQSSIHY